MKRVKVCKECRKLRTIGKTARGRDSEGRGPEEHSGETNMIEYSAVFPEA